MTGGGLPVAVAAQERLRRLVGTNSLSPSGMLTLTSAQFRSKIRNKEVLTRMLERVVREVRAATAERGSGHDRAVA